MHMFYRRAPRSSSLQPRRSSYQWPADVATVGSFVATVLMFSLFIYSEAARTDL